MPVIPFLKLIRYQNLLMIVLTQVLVKYFLFEPFGIAVSLDDLNFSLLVLSMISLAAAGNIINDIFDTATDAINKPERLIIGRQISEKIAYNWFFVFNILGVAIGFYLSNLIGQPSFSILFILPSALLYLYATSLKRTILVGNIIISTMVAMIIVMVGIFDLLPAITPENRTTQKVIFSILIDYGIFAFLINLLREMVKDQEDVKGDHNTGISTLPVLLGHARTNKIIFLIGLLPLAGVVYYIYVYLYEKQLAVYYALLLVMAPLLYFLIRLAGAKTREHYRHLSVILKMVLFFGLISIGLYRYILL